MSKAFRGIYAIPASPFDRDGELDHGELEHSISFSMTCGAHGLVGPVNVSEFAVLNTAERRLFVEIMCDTVGGSVPVVASVTAPTTREAVEHSAHAKKAGADAVIALPPSMASDARADELREYYTAIRAAAEVPVFIQNLRAPMGTPMTADMLAELLTIDGVDFVKEEGDEASYTMTQLFELAGGNLHGIIGGRGGIHLLDEFARGVCGTMPAQEFTDVHVALWTALDSGRLEDAEEIYRRLLPLVVLEAQFGAVPVCKEVLVRRGIISNAQTRSPGARPLDEKALDLLDRYLDEIADMMTGYPVV